MKKICYCCHIINITLCKRGINRFEQRRTVRLQKFRATAAPFVVDIRELFSGIIMLDDPCHKS